MLPPSINPLPPNPKKQIRNSNNDWKAKARGFAFSAREVFLRVREPVIGLSVLSVVLLVTTIFSITAAVSNPASKPENQSPDSELTKENKSLHTQIVLARDEISSLEKQIKSLKLYSGSVGKDANLPGSQQTVMDAFQRTATEEISKLRNKIKKLGPNAKLTGVKRDVLISILNVNSNLDPEFHHQFEFFGSEDFGDEEFRTTVYKDKHNELYLMMLGPSKDLMMFDLFMPLTVFVGEKTGYDCKGAAAFGRCVQRLAVAVDPSWVSKIYSWMNQNIPIAMISPGGAQTEHRHLLITFGANKIGGTRYMSFSVGVPEP